MNVLWITNILFPDAESEITGTKVLKSSGGWMLGLAEALLQRNLGINLTVATVSSLVAELTKVKAGNITYYVLPFGRGNTSINKEYEKLWPIVKNSVDPDIVHIHGSEFTHGLAYVRSCGSDRVLLSIQGLRNGYLQYQHSGISKLNILRNITLHDLVKGGGILEEYYSYKKLCLTEKELIQKVYHITGRTDWDKSHVWALNPMANYYFCNEILRKEFYEGDTWHYEKCKKHSIFLSQGAKPIKGLHQFLKALPIILQYYPDTTVRIAGEDITKSNVRYKWLKISGYGLFIDKAIKSNHLDGKVIFTGALDANKMKREYLNANVFVMPSSIENSPNSLGEAQMLGVPQVVAFVGGSSNMMVGNEQNLYRFEEHIMLAKKICDIFANEGNQINMRDIALTRHSQESNALQLLSIYKKIIG